MSFPNAVSIYQLNTCATRAAHFIRDLFCKMRPSMQR